MRTGIDRDVATFAALAGSKVLVAAANLAVTVFVARLLGPEGLASWVLLLAAATFLHTTFVNWTHPGTVRFGCEEWATGATLSRTVSARLLLLVPSLAVAALLLYRQPFDWLGAAYGLDRSWWPLVGLYGLSLWVAAEAQALFQARERMGRQAAVASVAAMATIGGLAVVLWSAGVAPALRDLVVVVGSVGLVIWGGAWIAELVASRARLVRPSAAEVRRQLRYAAPLLVGFGVAYVSIWGNHLLLRYLAPVEEIGYFGLSYQVFATVLAANGLLPTLMLPRLVGAHVRSPEAARTYLQQAVPTVFVVWAIGMVVATAALPPLLLRTSGAAFAPAALPMVVLCAIVPASVLTSLYAPLFNLQERHGRILLYAAMMAVVSAGLSVLLIPVLGAGGAALGTVAAAAAAQLAYMRDQHRRNGVAAAPVIRLWAVLVALGAVQIWVGTGIAARLLWAMAAVACVVWTGRRTSAVSRAVLDRLFGGALSPLGGALGWALISSVSSPLAAAGDRRAGTV